MGQFFNSRDWLRTPTFVDKDLYEPLPDSAQFDDAPLPVREMAAAPLPPPQREYDGGPSVDPGPQARQRITLDAAPLPPKPGLMRQIIGTAASAYLPQVGREIMAPGYDRKLREYNINKQRMMDEGKLNVQAADEAGKWARAGAEGSRSAAEQARRKKLEADAGNVGKKPITVNRNERLYDPTAGKVLLDAEESAEKLPTTFESYAVKALSIEDPAEREAALKRTTEAYNILHPEKPITQIKVGGNGEIVAVTVDPKKVVAAGGSMKVGQVSPRPVRASAAAERKAEEAEGDEVLIADLASAEPHTDWNNLGVKEQNRLRPKLLTKGWTEPVKLSVKQKDAIETMNTLEPKLKEILDEYEKTGSIAGTGRFVGRLPEESVTDQGQKNRIKMGDAFSMVAKLRSGGAIPEPEMVRLDAFLASQTRSDSFNVNALKDLLGSFKRSRESILKRPTSGGGPPPPPAGGSGKPPEKLGPPPAGTVWMRNPKTGKVGPVKMADVKQAEGFKYERVQ